MELVLRQVHGASVDSVRRHGLHPHRRRRHVHGGSVGSSLPHRHGPHPHRRRRSDWRRRLVRLLPHWISNNRERFSCSNQTPAQDRQKKKETAGELGPRNPPQINHPDPPSRNHGDRKDAISSDRRRGL
jgi:hypothetical protein